MVSGEVPSAREPPEVLGGGGHGGRQNHPSPGRDSDRATVRDVSAGTTTGLSEAALVVPAKTTGTAGSSPLPESCPSAEPPQLSAERWPARLALRRQPAGADRPARARGPAQDPAGAAGRGDFSLSTGESAMPSVPLAPKSEVASEVGQLRSPVSRRAAAIQADTVDSEQGAKAPGEPAGQSGLGLVAPGEGATAGRGRQQPAEAVSPDQARGYATDAAAEWGPSGPTALSALEPGAKALGEPAGLEHLGPRAVDPADANLSGPPAPLALLHPDTLQPSECAGWHLLLHPDTLLPVTAHGAAAGPAVVAAERAAAARGEGGGEGPSQSVGQWLMQGLPGESPRSGELRSSYPAMLSRRF